MLTLVEGLLPPPPPPPPPEFPPEFVVVATLVIDVLPPITEDSLTGPPELVEVNNALLVNDFTPLSEEEGITV